MSLSYWKALGSPQLMTSMTVLKDFDGHLFKPYRILTSLPIELGGKTASYKVEVIDVTLNYNLLLGCTWFYAMKAVMSTIFRILHFPHQGKTITIDQLDFCTLDLRSSTNVLFISECSSVIKVVGVFIF